MPSLERVSPVIPTYNEEPNIGRALQCLDWAQRVIVVDSESNDRTPDIVTSFDNAELFTRPFESHLDQWNYALGLVDTEWALTLDADYQVTPDVVTEIARIPNTTDKLGFFIPFRYHILGKTLRRSLYPPKQVLVRTRRASFVQDIDTERMVVDGESGVLFAPIVHDDRKDLRTWLESQARYSRCAAIEIGAAPWTRLSWMERLRRTKLLGPPAVLLYCLVGKGLLLDGWPGWYYALERATAEIILSMELIRQTFSSGSSS